MMTEEHSLVKRVVASQLIAVRGNIGLKKNWKLVFLNLNLLKVVH